jgi:hypothetical protein
MMITYSSVVDSWKTNTGAVEGLNTAIAVASEIRAR